VLRRHQYRSRGANRPPDIAVAVNFNAEFNLMTVNPIIEYFSRDPISEYCQGLESSELYTAPPVFVQSLHGCSNRSLPGLPFLMHAEEIIPTFQTSNIYIRLFHPKAHTLARLRSYNMLEALQMVRNNKSVGIRGHRNFRLLRDAFPYQLARGIPLKEGVPYHL
jgi:hypothetical protein